MGIALLERERELATFRSGLSAALSGRGRFLALEGPAGIGKTALLQHIEDKASARGAQVLNAGGVESDRDLKFGGLAQLLRGAPSPRSGSKLDTAQRIRHLAEHLASLGRKGPLVILVDDAHWLDPESLKTLGYLQPRISSLTLLLVIATRSDGADDDDLGRILADPATSIVRPAALSGEAVARLVGSRLGHAEPSFVEACRAATGGNPSLLAALLTQLEEHGVQPLAAEAVAVDRAGPRDIARALRFRGLAQQDGAALARAVAILGGGTSVNLAASLAGIDEGRASGAADALARDGYFAPGPRLAFTHPIVERSVYADIGALERAAAHKRAARLLAAHHEESDRVADQLVDAEPSGDAWAVEALRAAATEAMKKAAPDTAARYLRRALAEPPIEAVCAEVLLELGHAEEHAGERKAFGRYVEAHRVALDPDTRAEAAIAAAGALTAAGDRQVSAEMLAAAAAELPWVAESHARELESPIGLVAMYEPDVGAPELARLDQVDEQLVQGDALDERRLLCVLAGRRMLRSRDARQAVALIERALTGGHFVRDVGSQNFEVNLAALTLVVADELGLAEQVVAELAADAEARGTRYGEALASLLQAEIDIRRGALTAVEAEARTALELTRESGHIVVASIAAANLCLARVERGDLVAAREALREVDLEEREVPSDALYAPLLSVRGRLWLALGLPGRALVDLDECGARRERMESANPLLDPWRGPAALAYQALGQGEVARRLADKDVEAARTWGTPGAIGSTMRIRALVGDGTDRIGLLRTAVGLLEQSPARLEHAKAQVELGAALRRADRRADAREALVHGLDLADRCGASLLARRARDELAAIGVRPRRARITGAEALTGSELRVVRLAAAGLNNVEIAERLVVSRKTVEKHLGNAYDKLGVKSRAALPTHLPSDDPNQTPGSVRSR